MSDPNGNSPSSPDPAPEQRDGCLTAFMVIIGVILLLPGLCALIFGFFALSQRNWPSDIGGVIVPGLLVGAGGIWLIRRAFRR